MGGDGVSLIVTHGKCGCVLSLPMTNACNAFRRAHVLVLAVLLCAECGTHAPAAAAAKAPERGVPPPAASQRRAAALLQPREGGLSGNKNWIGGRPG
jgi:hypothetical protein